MLLKYLAICFLVHLVSAKKHNNCSSLLVHLAINQTNLLRCITTNSVPVTMCTVCKTDHDDLLVTYDELATNCTDMYFDKDRINMVASTESVLVGLWTKAYCDDCFNNNNSINFDKKNSTFYGCLGTSISYNPCEKCKAEYMDLNNFYVHLDQHNNGEVCYDLQDSMNRTRNKWSKELKCCRREYNMMLFTITLCIICSLPLLFYVSTYLITKRQEERHNSVLYNDEPLRNSSAASTSGRGNINNINNPSQTMANQNSSSSNSASAINNLSSSTSKPNQKQDFKKLNEDLDSSDDEILSTSVDAKGKFK